MPDPLDAFVLFTATASLTALSASRHGAISDRFRKLTEEYRGIPYDNARRTSIEGQIHTFKWRSDWSAWGHLSFYIALAIETLMFGLLFWLATEGDDRSWLVERLCQWNAIHKVREWGLPTAFVFIFVGVTFHLAEHSKAWSTLKAEHDSHLEAKKDLERHAAANGPDAKAAVWGSETN